MLLPTDVWIFFTCIHEKAGFLFSNKSSTHLLVALNVIYHMSLVMRKPAFGICENKDADQLRGKREADQRLCCRYLDSTIPLLPKSEILSF